MRWGERVLERDKVCPCGSPATEAHHIYPKAKWPELRTVKENGIGLCKECHKAVYGKEEDAIEAFLFCRPLQARRLGEILKGVMRIRMAAEKVGLRRKA